MKITTKKTSFFWLINDKKPIHTWIQLLVQTIRIYICNEYIKKNRQVM